MLMCIAPDLSLSVHTHLYLYIERYMVLFLVCSDVFFFFLQQKWYHAVYIVLHFYFVT